MAVRPAHLRGGPMDGHDGEVVTPSPEIVTMGANGGFIYRLAGIKDGVVQYRYDAPASRRALVAAGVAPSLAAFAVDDTHAANLLLNGSTPDPGETGMQVPVEVKRYSDRWELWANVNGKDVLVEKLPRSAFPDDDSDGIKQWVEASVQALAAEAMKG